MVSFKIKVGFAGGSAASRIMADRDCLPDERNGYRLAVCSPSTHRGTYIYEYAAARHPDTSTSTVLRLRKVKIRYDIDWGADKLVQLRNLPQVCSELEINM